MPAPSFTATLVGGPTTLIEYAGLRWLTDPTFDPPGRYEREGAPALEKLSGPALVEGEIGDVDVVLVSHDHHPDNLDAAGRAYLGRARRVLTTTAGAGRLEVAAAGLEPWAFVDLGAASVLAVPAQHGPDGTDHLTGPVIGFVLRAGGLPSVYISGDNASVDVVRRIVDRVGKLDIAVLHAGGASLAGRFDGALLTLGADEAVAATRILGSRTVVAVHQEGWAHFSQGPQRLRGAFEAAGLADRLAAPAPGEAVTID